VFSSKSETPLVDPHQSQKPAINNAVSRARGFSKACQVKYGLRHLGQNQIKREVAMPGCVRDRIALMAVGAAALLAANAANAEKKYDPGASDTEIRIGNIMPYSGPASSYGVIGKAEAAYFNMINAQGGINGRKIAFISYDDAYSPPKAIEQARKLVESDEVLLIFQSLGTPSNSAIQKYMNARKVPQLFVASGATKFGDSKNFPWTMGFQPNYQSEGRIYAKYILNHYPNGKIAVFWQNDDAGRDQFKGLKDGLGDRINMIVADKSYEVSDPSIDSQIVALHDSGADIFFSWAAPKGSAQAIRKVGELGWKPKFFLANTATTIASVLKPAGLEYSKGIISTAYVKDPTDPRWKDDSGVRKWREFMDKYYPDGDKANANNAYAYVESQAMVQVLKQCGDNLSRENVMKQAANLKNFTSDMLLPGISINTSPDDYFPIEQMQLMRFNGESWELFGDIITGEVGHEASH
jgi:ABC-type branched-subunit amino acid transport system substrate-binding protein